MVGLPGRGRGEGGGGGGEWHELTGRDRTTTGGDWGDYTSGQNCFKCLLAGSGAMEGGTTVKLLNRDQFDLFLMVEYIYCGGEFE